MKKLPQIRNENIVVQHLDDEVLIYFLQTDKAVCLNSTSSIIFNHCNGKTTFDDLKNKYKFTDDLIYFTLDKLNENNLLKEYDTNTHFAGLSRREVIKRIGLGSMIALPVISSVIAPISAHAASGTQANGTRCTSNPCVPGTTCVPTSNGNTYCCSSSPPPQRFSPGSNPLGDTDSGTCSSTVAPRCCTGTATYTANPANPGFGSCVCNGTA